MATGDTRPRGVKWVNYHHVSGHRTDELMKIQRNRITNLKNRNYETQLL